MFADAHPTRTSHERLQICYRCCAALLYPLHTLPCTTHDIMSVFSDSSLWHRCFYSKNNSRISMVFFPPKEKRTQTVKARAIAIYVLASLGRICTAYISVPTTIHSVGPNPASSLCASQTASYGRAWAASPVSATRGGQGGEGRLWSSMGRTTGCFSHRRRPTARVYSGGKTGVAFILPFFEGLTAVVNTVKPGDGACQRAELQYLRFLQGHAAESCRRHP
ncbi:hypothetical protein C8R46DRAFT_657507 [Mycena filopes]|nr:hypothetical protein C8R46DRAFT_657507 [Mycena filopes]